MSYFEIGFEEECARSGINPRALVKQAALSEEEFKRLRHLKGMRTDTPGLYKEYRRDRKLAKLLATLWLAAKGGAVGFAGAGKGTTNPAETEGAPSDAQAASAERAGMKRSHRTLAGAGIGGLLGYGLSGLSLALMDHFDRNRIKKYEKGEAPSLLTSLFS